MKMSNQPKFANFGQLLMKKDKSGFYIKLDENVRVQIKDYKTGEFEDFKGDMVSVRSPIQQLQQKLANGKIDQEEYEAKAPRYEKGGDLDFVRQNLFVVMD